MPQHSEICHKQRQYATNIIANMHIDISSSEEAYREDIDMCSRCDIYVFARIAHISIYIAQVQCRSVHIVFSDLGAHNITRFIRITHILRWKL